MDVESNESIIDQEWQDAANAESQEEQPALTAEQAKARRKVVRAWITRSLNIINMGTTPDRKHTPEITIANVRRLSLELLNLDDLVPDDRVEEYAVKIGSIVRHLETELVRQDQERVERRRRDLELLKIEAEEKKLTDEIEELTKEKAFKDELQRLQLEEKRASIASARVAQPTPKTACKAIRLDLKIPQFDGSPCRYRQFEELFDSLVGNSTAYDDAAKYLYFKSLIGKHGDQFAANLSPTKQSLDIVKERMKEQYDNPGRIRARVQANLQELPTYKLSSPVTLLHQLIVSWEEALLALRNAGTVEEQINNTYLVMMTKHLPKVILNEVGFKPNWSVEKFIAEMKVYYKDQRDLAEYASETVKEAKPRTNVHTVTTQPPTNQGPKRPLNRQQSSTNRSPNSQPAVVNSPRCLICSGSHLSIYCNSHDVNKRRDIVNQKGLCPRCLRDDGHALMDCRSKYVCPCGRSHSRVLCTNPSPRPIANGGPTSGHNVSSKPQQSQSHNGSGSASHNSQQTSPKTVDNTKSSTMVSMSLPHTRAPKPDFQIQSEKKLDFSRPASIVSFYMTVVVRVNGKKVRVLLDGAAGRSSIRKSCAKRLGLATYRQEDLIVGGVTGNSVTSNSFVKATLHSLLNSNSLEVVLMVMPTLGKMNPPAIPNSLWWELQDSGIRISDTFEHHCQPIDIILGLEYVNQIWLSTEQLVTNHVSARNSIFGWTASGVTTRSDEQDTASSTNVMCSSFELAPKNCLSASELTVEEKDYLSDFVENKVTIDNKRITVQLPWLKRPEELGINSKQSRDRFEKLVKSLRRNNRFEVYSASMAETVEKFAEPAPIESSLVGKVYYLPHHCVLRPDKSTSQLRIVFDGSATEPGFASLNDSLFKGVNSWSSLDLLTSFRFGRHAVVADIEKAFLQITVHPSDRDALRFWWYDENGKVIAYRFKSVPFGTSASPFLLYAAMHKLFSLVLADDRYPQRQAVASIIEDRFYVDDLMVAFQSSSPAPINTIRDETVALFGTVSMNVRKWRTNHRATDAQWSTDAPSQLKLLGYKWNIEADQLSPSVNILSHIRPTVVTKRLFTSIIAHIYDPQGFVMPYIVHLRLLLSKLWSHSLDWDEPVPEPLLEEALIAVRDADLVNKVAVDRNVMPDHERDSTLLVYCDASKHAVGIVAYSLIGESSKFILSRARINKLTLAQESKEDTIAKLELDGLVMAAETVHQLNRIPVLSFDSGSMNAQQSRPFGRVIICSDSLINLQRLAKHPNDQKSWISLRINKLAKLAPGAEFRHVTTKENPADIVSRGATMTDLLTNQQWYDPPPPSEFTRFSDEIHTLIATMAPIDPTCQCSRFGTYGKAISAWRRIARWSRRALTNSHPAVPDRALGKLLLIKFLQRQHFGQEIDAITEGKPVDRDSILKCFKCFLDADGLLRLRSRLKEGKNLTVDQVNPIILPKSCHLVELIVQNEHVRLGHPGSDRTMYSVRDQYFVIGLRRYVRRLVNQCMICKRLRGKTGVVDLGMVPEFRYDYGSTPFTNIGLDIFGPLKVAMKTKGKRYGVIFSCATTRAVHIEPIHDMTAKSVFQALLDFMARRGIPHRIYTDNGVNLLAVKKQLLSFLEQISNQYPGLELNVEWTQLTASSPWRGGFYERLIRSIKDTLSALTFGKVIDNDTLGVTLHLIEARLNSRPLFVHDGQVITPAHFFAKRPLTQLPPIGSKVYATLDHSPLVKDYKIIQSHINAVWNTWYNQYLLHLKSFHQNVYEPNQSDSLRVGDAVILKSNTPSENWPFGVVDEVVTSEDGQVRTVYVRTHDRGRLTVKARDIRTLIPFECTREVQEEDIAHSDELIVG